MKLLALAACAAPRVVAPIVIANDDDPPVVVPVGPFPSLDAYCLAVHDCSPVDLHASRDHVGPFDAVIPMQRSEASDSRCVVALEEGGAWFVAPSDGEVCASEGSWRTRRARVSELDRDTVEIDFDIAERTGGTFRFSIVCAAHACTPMFESEGSRVALDGGVVTITSVGARSDGDGVYRLDQTPNPMPIRPASERGAEPITP